MDFRKIAGPMRIDTTSGGAEQVYVLRGRPGGRTVKTLQYMVKVLASSGSNCRIGVDADHGPDGEIYKSLKVDIVAYAAASAPVLLDGAIGAATLNSEVVGEWIRPSVKIKEASQSSAQWATVEVWEMRKPF